MVPTKDVVQGLLSTVDLLNEMVNNPANMDEIDITETLAAINKVLLGSTSDIEKEELENDVEIKDHHGNTIFHVKEFDLKSCVDSPKGGENLYLLSYDLHDDIELKNKTPQSIINELIELSYLIESRVDFDHIPDLEKFQKVSIPFYILVCTVLEIDMVLEFFGLQSGSITELSQEGKVLNQLNDSEPAASAIDFSELEEINDAINKAEEAVAGKTTNEDPASLVNAVQEKGDDFKSFERKDVLEEFKKEAETAPAVKAETKTTTPVKTVKKESPPAVKATENLRVNIKILDDLMSLAGELVLARNQLTQAAENDELETMKIASNQINTVTSNLQEAIMKTRMQPIGSVFNKFKRIVRDLSKDLGKEVKLEIEGETVELDKTIIESINDPLTHIIRNSMDHGIESPKTRIANGKRPEGTLSIKAYHEAGKIIIEIDDDGNGIDPVRVGQKAVSSGIITDTQLARMSEKEIVNLIFKPGFSTAEEVTEVSGRGVGMDVVMTNLNKLGGVVDLNSILGTGTRLKISLPLTLAIMPSLLAVVDEQVYAIPQVNLAQIVRIPVEEITERLLHVGDSLVIRFLDNLIPVVSAHEILEADTKPIPMDEDNYGFDKPIHILVVAAGEFHYGIIVDQTLESQEIVVKPLGRNFKYLRIYAGATILGDGSVATIFDIAGILSEMEISAIDSGHNKEEKVADAVSTRELQKLLIVNNGHTENFALPLNSVLRIDRIAKEDIEHIGSMRTCSISGKSIALFCVSDVADVGDVEDSATYAIILFEALGRRLGFLAREIIDSVEVVVEFDEFTHKQVGILGSTFINEKLTMLVDLFGVVAAKKPEWVEKEDIYIEKADTNKTILVVDDSKFFLNQIADFVTEAG
jgi:two-component system chemotaxis sensor kinase CheA